MGETSRSGRKTWRAARVALFVVAGCGSGAGAPPGPGDYVPPRDGAAGDAIDAMGDARGDAPRGADAGPLGDARSTSFGDLPILDIADTPCVPAAAPATLLSNVASTAGGFEKVGQLGERRFAFGTEGSVAITFGYDGASPSSPLLGPLAVAAQNGALESVIAMGDGLGLKFYDAAGTPAGDVISLGGAMVSGPSLGAGPTASLAVWCTPQEVTGRLVDQRRMLGPMLTLVAGAAGDGACRTATQWNGTNFSVLWTRRLHDGKTKTSIAYVDLDGTLNFGKVVVLSDGVHELIDFARAPFGYVALLDEGEQAGNPVAVRLDAFGNVLPPAFRLRGSRHSFGVATFGSEFAVGALLGDGRAAMRPFDSRGALGPWVCVDDRTPDMPFAGRAALGTDDQGYAVVARMSDGSNWYMRTDRLGDGVPGSD